MVETTASVAQSNGFDDPIYKKFEGVLKDAKVVSVIKVLESLRSCI